MSTYSTELPNGSGGDPQPVRTGDGLPGADGVPADSLCQHNQIVAILLPSEQLQAAKGREKSGVGSGTQRTFSASAGLK
ncbi:unnamed protein product [marine sediment metagenome]|uniref:Uncharacterized protein n=1 Tax=marine sediment metagenome TaxID=412755 RepID=X0WUV0_9ZZZZ